MVDCTPNRFLYKLLCTLGNVLTKFRYSIQKLTMWFSWVYVQWQSYLRLSRYLRERKMHQLWNIPAQIWEIVPPTDFDRSCFVPLSMCWRSFVTQFRGWRCDSAVCKSNVNALRDCPDLYGNVKCINFETFQLSYGRLYPKQILIQVALYPRQCVDEVSLLNSEADDVIRLCVCSMSMLSVIVPISMLT